MYVRIYTLCTGATLLPTMKKHEDNPVRIT
jgi:hypothetical protein